MKSTPQFVEKLFTAREREYCDRCADSARHYAARFCAKEAFQKAVSQPIDWLDMEVVNEDSGQPVIRPYRRALEIVGGCSIAVSLSHAGDYAMATVIIWGDRDLEMPPTS